MNENPRKRKRTNTIKQSLRNNAPAFHRFGLEQLEDRRLLNSAPVLTLAESSYTITEGDPWYIPLTSTDADGDTVYYKVEAVDSARADQLSLDLSIGTAWDSAAETQTDVAFRNPYMEMTVSQANNEALQNGVMRFELFADKAPLTVSQIRYLVEDARINFTDSAGNLVPEPYYQNVLFHRVIAGFMSQFGTLDQNLIERGSLVGTIEDEYDPDLQMTSSGVLAMANTGYRDSGGAQFFITSDRCDWLDFKHSVFGFLVSGQDVQEAVNSVSVKNYSVTTQRLVNSAWTETTQTWESFPDTAVIATNVSIVTNYTDSTLTVRATSGSVFTTTIRVTPVDSKGMAGQPKLITLNIQADTSTQNAPPILVYPEYAYTSLYSGKTDNVYQIEAYDREGDAIGYEARLIQQQDTDGDGKYEWVNVPGASYDYQTGEVTIDTTSLTTGAYYLAVTVGVYTEGDTTVTNYTDSMLLTFIVTPPAPAQVQLAEESDGGTLGDGITGYNENLNIVVSGCTPGAEVYLVNRVLDSTTNKYTYTLVDKTTCPEDASSVTFTISGTIGAGSYDLCASESVSGIPFMYLYQTYTSDAIESAFSDIFTLTVQFLTQPANLALAHSDGDDGITSSTISLVWDTVANADKYAVYWKKSSDDNWIYDLTTTESYTISGLASLTEYDIMVQAMCTDYAYGPSAYTAMETVVKTLDSIPVVDKSKVRIEVGVDSFTNEDKISVSWEPVEEAVAYIVEYKAAGAAEWQAARVDNSENPQVEVSVGGQGTIWQVRITTVVKNTATQKEEYSQPLLAGWATDSEYMTMTASLQKSLDWNYSVASATLRESVDTSQEWEYLVMEIWTNELISQLTNGMGLSVSIQFDSSLYVPGNLSNDYVFPGLDWTTSLQTCETENMYELTLNLAVVDAQAIANEIQDTSRQLLAMMVPFYPADQTSGNTAGNGVAVQNGGGVETTAFVINDKNEDVRETIPVDVYAVPYDLNDSGKVDMADFILFARQFGQVTPTAEEIASGQLTSDQLLTAAANFTGGTKISMEDFILFARNFNISSVANTTVYSFAQEQAQSAAMLESEIPEPAGLQVGLQEGLQSGLQSSVEVTVPDQTLSPVIPMAEQLNRPAVTWARKRLVINDKALLDLMTDELF